MRKSSLGRRSSTHIPVRVPSIGGSASRTCSGKKSTGNLLKPGFSQGPRQRRSQSADRESYGNASGRPTMTFNRANSMNVMTPITPRHTSIRDGLPTTGSARAPKNQLTSIDSNRRMSSFGGAKRKDTRPIAEKSFQQAAQAKVQEYFNIYATDVIGPGNLIRPMNTKLFVDMMNHLLQNIFSRKTITKTNYLEELPMLLKKLGYRSKVDKSWLMTVNTPHSWQHVIAVLCWLVDLKEIMDLTDPFEMMYPSAVGEQTKENEEEEEDEEDFMINKDIIFHLKRSYHMRQSDEDRIAYLDVEYLEKQIIELKCTDEDLDTLQRQIDLIKEELENETQRKDLLLEESEKLQAKQKAANDDCEMLKEYIEKTKHFVDTAEVKVGTKEKEIMVKKAALDKKKEELQKILDKVTTQQISLDEIEKLNTEKINLQRTINFYENAKREYENSAFTVDIKLAEDQKKLEKLVLEYNKLLAEKVILEPRLRNCEIKLQLMTDCTALKMIDSNLKVLKEEYKTSINDLESKKEDCENILKRAKEDMEITREEISKESTLLEGIECDYEKQKELGTKKIEKLKVDLSHCQKMTKDISEELAQFDPAKLEEKKQKLKMLQHDYELAQKRSKEFLVEYQEIVKENIDAVTPVIAEFNENIEKIENEFL